MPLTKHSLDTPLPLNTFRDDIPRELERLVQMLMAKKRSERVQLAEQLADVLRYIANTIVAEQPQPDTIRLVDHIDEMMQLEGVGVAEMKTPVRPPPPRNCTSYEYKCPNTTTKWDDRYGRNRQRNSTYAGKDTAPLWNLQDTPTTRVCFT